jgi:predicted RNA binding protein YcfA (HicA-like mRNA interferase family)
VEFYVVDILARFGFALVGQSGSPSNCGGFSDGSRQTLTIPMHRELDPGTAAAIFRQASQYIPSDQLRPHFYS